MCKYMKYIYQKIDLLIYENINGKYKFRTV